MKRYISILLMVIFVATSVLPVLADGIGNNELKNYLGVINYRDFSISNNLDHLRPKAGFALQINSNGVLGNEILSGSWDMEKNILSIQDSPKITANAGDKIVISDRSSIGSGSKITQYDIQYRFVPKGENRETHEIKYAFVNNFASVKNIVENLPLNQAGTYEIFLCVMDNAPTIFGTANWSANGNIRSINTGNPNFPEGMFWYFPEALVEVGGSPADFYPTPEGESEWREEFIISPKTYIGEVGQTLNISVNLYNQGEEDITDFGCTWYGAGWDNILCSNEG